MGLYQFLIIAYLFTSDYVFDEGGTGLCDHG